MLPTIATSKNDKNSFFIGAFAKKDKQLFYHTVKQSPRKADVMEKIPKQR
jgi:hypothetical protein